ncbi:MAG: class II fructose-bisphosphate aldolase [Ruminococcaceae bacterium]|nr:class II fructose-bisphosphate aldolase [Oscillospiraceae bacterium]
MLVNMNEIMLDAQRNKYAVGLFNTTDTDALEAAIAAAEELRSPIMIGTAEVLLPYGELQLIGPAMINMAKKATVPVAIHYDHGLTAERCREALELGFSSVMYDCSTDAYEGNIQKVREMVELAHSLGATVEGELGHVGDNVDSKEGDSHIENPSAFYTDPDMAEDFVKRTGIDALAIAIGTAHGTYTCTPKLDIERLKAIRAKIDTPLVLHGGSGLSAADLQSCIKNGITKVNIFTDLYVAGKTAMADQSGDYHMIRIRKVQAIKEVVKEKILLFGSNGRA